jgi:hypothetical protein
MKTTRGLKRLTDHCFFQKTIAEIAKTSLLEKMLFRPQEQH